MKLTKRSRARLLRERRQEAEQELAALRDALLEARRSFNRSAEAALAEASILELGALEARYDRALRALKTLIGETDHGISDPRNPRDHRRRAHLAHSEAAEKAH